MSGHGIVHLLVADGGGISMPRINHGVLRKGEQLSPDGIRDLSLAARGQVGPPVGLAEQGISRQENPLLPYVVAHGASRMARSRKGRPFHT